MAERCVDIEQHGVISANHCRKEVFQTTYTRTSATRKCFLIFIKYYNRADASREKKSLHLKLKR